MDNSQPEPSWTPAASLATLEQRARFLARLRTWFADRGFIEVQTPLLTRECIIDRYVEPVAVPLAGESFYLHTSPEFAMKRLLAAGMKKIWQICPVFRAGENGRRHNTEFTMLEWYETGVSYEQGRDFLAQLICDMTGTATCGQIPYEDALFAATGLHFGSSLAELRAFAENRHLAYPSSWLTEGGAEWTDWLDLIFDACLLPGFQDPVIIYDFPWQDSQLARIRTVTRHNRQQEVTARYELYYRGLELANGYDELTDATELADRFHHRQEARARDGRNCLPDGHKLLAAMASGLPNSCGCALGVDRLFMLLAGLDSIDQTIAFPYDRA
ncbi:MAG: elongation factor P--(R)-beta-lysine ligase [Planctomycetia bacterium]|nr:elongation factor P--(R)-beta-lysine ligase [Planctomycetia bacterium]